jgi:hypothetical protein
VCCTLQAAAGEARRAMQLSSYTAAQRHYIEHSTQHEQTELGGLLLQPLPTTSATTSNSSAIVSTSKSSSSGELTLLAQGDGFFSNGAHSKALHCYQQQLQGKIIDTHCAVFMVSVSFMLVTVSS